MRTNSLAVWIRRSESMAGEAARLVDPALPAKVIAELAEELVPLAKHPQLKDVDKPLTQCDGTLLEPLPRLAESMWKHRRTGITAGGCTVSSNSTARSRSAGLADYRNRADSDEGAVLGEDLHAGRCYVMDRGYCSDALIDAVVAAGSDYVCWVKRCIGCEVTEQREPKSQAKEASGVVRDLIVRRLD